LLESHSLSVLSPPNLLSEPAPTPSLPPAAFRSLELNSRREVVAYLDRLNTASPVATRQVARWGSEGSDSLKIRAVAMPARYAELGAFMGESRTTFAMSIDARREAPAAAPYSIGVLLSGSMRIHHGSLGERVIRAGEGVIVNPSEIERTWLEADTHLVEFMLPKSPMLSLGAEWAPGSLTGLPQFEPRLDPGLAQRLHFMAHEAMQAVPLAEEAGDGRFRRWLELIGLTLLHEQAVRNAVQARLRAPEPPPAAVRRALDFIDAHVAADIMLADIAAAANLSVSSLGRMFNRHLGQSPAALLRDLRLDRVRDELRRGSAMSIRELALRWGFQSASQFSQAYQRRFAEKPSEARARG